jgi:hypothetical protein
MSTIIIADKCGKFFCLFSGSDRFWYCLSMVFVLFRESKESLVGRRLGSRLTAFSYLHFRPTPRPLLCHFTCLSIACSHLPLLSSQNVLLHVVPPPTASNVVSLKRLAYLFVSFFLSFYVQLVCIRTRRLIRTRRNWHRLRILSLSDWNHRLFRL